MVVRSNGLVAWVPADAVDQNGDRGAIAAAVAQNAWVPAEAAARTGWIPAPGLLVMDGEEALDLALQHGWISPTMVLEWNRAVVQRRNGPDNMAAANASMGNPALYLAFLCLPAQEIARCRRVCPLWRDITSAEVFRRHHHDHHYRTPMPLFFFLDPTLARLNLRAVDSRSGVSRPVIHYARPSNHEVLRIHGSSAGILLLSSGRRLYALNPSTRRWARLPSLHVENDIVGFYVTPAPGGGDFESKVLYHDRAGSYWIFTLGTAAPPPNCIGRPGPEDLNPVLARGIAPSYKIPPVFFGGFLHWPPKAVQDNVNVLMFDVNVESFDLVLPPSIQVGGEGVPVVGRQLCEIDECLAMTVVSFSPPRVDVWVQSDQSELWSRRYSIRVPVDAISLNDGCHHSATPKGLCSIAISLLATGPPSPDTQSKKASFYTPPFSRWKKQMLLTVTRLSSDSPSGDLDFCSTIKEDESDDGAPSHSGCCASELSVHCCIPDLPVLFFVIIGSLICDDSN
jgi:hypothetical protein